MSYQNLYADLDIKSIRTLIAREKFGASPLSLLCIKENIKNASLETTTSLFNRIQRDESLSKNINFFRLALLHYLSKISHSEISEDILNRYNKINSGSGYLSKGNLISLEELQSSYEILIPLSFMRDSKPNFDKSAFFQDISKAEEFIASLFRSILTDRKEGKNSLNWYQNSAKAVREIYDNILTHSLNQFVDGNLSPIIELPKTEFWFVQIRRYSSLNQLKHFMELPNFKVYKTALSESGKNLQKFIAVTISNDGPSMVEYFNNFRADREYELKEIIENHLTTAPTEGAGMGCENAILHIANNGGFIAFFSGNYGYTAFNHEWLTTTKPNSMPRKAFDLPFTLNGTSVHMLIPYLDD